MANMRIGLFRQMVAPVAILVVVVGCADVPTGVDFAGDTRLIVQANLEGTATSALVVEVSAEDIRTPLLFNLPVQGGAASGTITVPAGSDRLLTARAFDRRGVETHLGSRTLQVQRGTNDAVGITLLPLQGEQPIEVTVASYTVSVAPGAATIAPGETLQLEATVRDADGDEVPEATVQWASLGLAVATVSAAGLVTARGAGEAQIVAVYAGAGAAALVAVEGS